ncbi:MAG: hypothetical protein A2W31_11640 [Planctomycetes bacterium RBG_16_64_10]|nr:MAG: hypothetical protein A2W31_11640 [Planctomycetes bacterium RBG_16_64_10]
MGGTAADAAGRQKPLRIVGLACSLRQGKTTFTATSLCLEAAKQVAPDQIAIEVLDLAARKIPAGPAAGIELPPGEQDDFPAIAQLLSDPATVGMVVGTPVYFGSMSSLCKAFLERCAIFRQDQFTLANKVAGVLAVGGARNGGQELTLRAVHTALFAQEMIVVGDGRPTAHWGGTLWNNAGDEIWRDEPGVATAKNLGRRVAEIALRLHGR